MPAKWPVILSFPAADVTPVISIRLAQPLLEPTPPAKVRHHQHQWYV
ncbi:hypothetical protein HRbin28_02335 [bacterium HR28]|nr:hypothetical protein HRbin28_02335 [bacterium HR28]